MRVRIKSLAKYETKTAEDDDCKWFLSNIQAITMQFDERRHGYKSMLNATAGFLNCRQQPEQSVTNYMEVLRSHIDTVEYNIDIAPETAMDGRKLSETDRKKIARDCCTLAAALIRGADRTRFSTLQTNLENQYSNGKDEYPTDLTSAYGMLATYRTPINAPRPPRGALSFSRSSDNPQSTSTQVTMTTAESTAHRIDWTEMKFREHACGLYVFSPPSSTHDVTPGDDYIMLLSACSPPVMSQRPTTHAGCTDSLAARVRLNA